MPLPLALIAAALAGGGALFRGIGSGIAQGAQHRANQRQAAKLEDIANMLNSSNPENLANLRNASAQALQAGQAQMNAQLASRGLFNSGFANQQLGNIQASMQSQLARDIANNELARAAQLQSIYENPVFGSAQLPAGAMILGGLGQGLGAAGTALGGSIPFLNQQTQPGGLPFVPQSFPTTPPGGMRGSGIYDPRQARPGFFE